MNRKGKFIIIFVLLIIVIVFFYFFRDGLIKKSTQTEINDISDVVNISERKINEENFYGSVPEISGFGMLAEKAKKYIEETVSNFKQRADAEVPEMKKKFGVDSPPATFILDIKAKIEEGQKTKSIVFSEYYYTGGANGMDIYTVFTSDIKSGDIVSLSDIIKKEKLNEFTLFVKSKLFDWYSLDASNNNIFLEEIGDLTFESFLDWSMDEKNLTIYFDKYEIGPGVLGAMPFYLSLSEIADYIK